MSDLAGLLRDLQTVNVFEGLYWWVQGERPVQVGDAAATFVTDDLAESLVLTYSLETERPVLADLVSELDADDVVFDVGANYGLYSCLTASVVAPERVYAFEPHPTTRPRLQRNHARNGTEAVTLVDAALSDAGGTVGFDPPSRYRSIAGTSAIDPDAETGHTVDAVTGDDFCRQPDVPSPSVLKIDVEGAELDVLRGFTETLSRTCRLVYCEVHGGDRRTSTRRYGATPADVRTLLADHGYSVTTLQRRGDERHLKARSD